LAILVAGVILVRSPLTTAVPRRNLRDSLIVVERGGTTRGRPQVVVGDLSTPSPAPVAADPRGTWIESLRLPWMNPRLAPDKRFAAAERMTPRGTDLYLIGHDRPDTSLIAIGGGDDIALGWS